MNDNEPPIGWDNGLSTPEGRWARLGPYYAMFPISFARKAVLGFSRPGDLVVDPFCGRGTVPYVATLYGRDGVGCDVNPVAWIYATTKTSPPEVSTLIIRRLSEIQDQVSTEDRQPCTEFQELAFCRQVLGFVNAARRTLDWRHDPVDRSLAAFLAHHLHSKLGEGLSNQLRHSKAMAPGYCVRWWRANGYAEPPQVNPVEFLSQKIEWRYKKGIPFPPRGVRARIGLGDASDSLPMSTQPARLVVTSPPYSGVTNYRTDSWLRLWALGAGPPSPSWCTKDKHEDLSTYEAMIRSVFAATLRTAAEEAVWLIRCDARLRTRRVVEAALLDIAAGRPLCTKLAPYRTSTQTALYGDGTAKPGEVDLLLLPHGVPPPDGWVLSDIGVGT